MRDEETKESHPAYGMAGFHRVSGGGKKFFGSSVGSDNYITFAIHKAYRKHSLGQDWYGTEEAAPIIEIALTSHQFAEMLTSMNVGNGVPCTIQYLDGKMVPKIEEQETEADRVKAEFKKSMQDYVKSFDSKFQKIEEILSADKISKQGRGMIRALMESVRTEVVMNNPFYLKQFEEATAQITTQAKAEVDAFITHAIVKTGLDALKNKGVTLQLEGREDEL